MSRARPVLAALLLVVASAAPVLAATGAVSAPVQPADDPVVGISENTTRVLLLTRADAAAFERPHVSVTDALDEGHAGVTAQFKLEVVQQRVAATDSKRARAAILENATDWAAQRMRALRERERSVRAAFAAGDITATQYLLALGTVHEKAASLQAFLGQSVNTKTIYGFADNSEDLRTRISRIRAKLITLQGPVRERIAAVIAGNRDTLRVHVTVGNGVMLSVIDGGTYVRETYRPDNVDDELSGAKSGTLRTTSNLYPWVSNVSSGSWTFLDSYAFEYAATHPDGRLVSYVDTTTERVYVEYQWKTLSDLPATMSYRASANNTTLLVSRTYTGGPVLVRAENATGAPVDVPVLLNGTRIGTTGTDGRLWTLSPAGEYTVSIVRNGAKLNVTVVARPAP